MNIKIKLVLCLVAAFGFLMNAAETKPQQPNGDKGRADGEQENFLTDVPAYPFNVIAARPTTDSITLNLFAQNKMSGTVECESIRKPFALEAGNTCEVKLSGLQPNREYIYKIGALTGSFHTAKPAGTPFTFTIQADSHLDGSCNADLYKIMLSNVAKDKPDFHIDLGDTFMTGKHPSRESAAKQYLAQRYYFGLIGKAIPLYLVLGNHDGEEVKRQEDTSLAEWSLAMRKKYFTNPEPDGFYTGNNDGRQDYYAWTWGDALFVALDPYWYSTSNHGGKEMDNMKLGDTQFAWLEKTLRESKSKFKFVFIHQLTGGLDRSGRGGAEAAKLHQWGKVHELLKETGVDIVFHGHDHFYARQEVDGIIYQLVPQGAHRNFKRDSSAEYGYKEGVFLPNSGHLRVEVSPNDATVTYVRSATEPMEHRGVKNGDSSQRYVIRKQ